MIIDFEGPIFSGISFAHVVRNLVFAFEELGHPIALSPTDRENNLSILSDIKYYQLIKMCKRKKESKIKIFYNFPVNLSRKCKGKNFPIVSWETTAIPKDWVNILNSDATQTWAVSKFVQKIFSDGGVNRVKTLSLGFDEALFNPNVAPKQLESNKTLKLLHLGVAQYRKGTDLLLQSYSEEFNKNDDICLVIKSNGYGEIKNKIYEIQSNSESPEIEYIYGNDKDNEIPGYYAACDLMIYPVHAEGAGLPVLESLACGKPVMVPLWSGVMDYCNENNSFGIPFTIAPTKRKYTQASVQGMECWAEISVKDLKKKLRYVYENQHVVKQKAKIAYNSIKHLTWKNMAKTAIDYIEETS